MSESEMCNRNQDKKYVVYNNDLKFRDLRNIDKNNADWNDENVKEKFGKDFDTITYRLKESKKCDFVSLDLSRLSLEKMPNLSAYKYYNEISVKLKHLFLNDNKLTKCDERISCFTNLEVLDISFNQITEITFLPKYLKEFVCHTNKISSILAHGALINLDCSTNNITVLGEYPELKDLICSDNKIGVIKSYPKMKRLICKQNPTIQIEKQVNLTHLDCSNTNISGISGDFPNLSNLICNYTKINDISKLQKLESLEMIGCDIYIYYIKSLKYLLCKDYEKITISGKYKVQREITEQYNTCIIFDTM